MDWKDLGTGGFGAVVGGIATFLWSVWKEGRKDQRETHQLRLAEAKQNEESAQAEKKLAIDSRDQTLEEITALHARFERVWERFDRTDADLRETRAELGIAQLKILECEARDAVTQNKLRESEAREAEKAHALALADERTRTQDAKIAEQAALLHSIQTEFNEMRRDHYGVVETATSAVEKVEELVKAVGIDPAGDGLG